MDSFKTGTSPDKINRTLITLVPKVPSLLNMSQLRPIRLCNTIYKTISKFVVQRLRSLLPNLISPNQVAFVPGRQIKDNIVVAQEVLHKFKSMKGKKGYIAWKIDLAKAYDKLQLSFIRNVIMEVGFDGKFVDLIMWCISSVQYQATSNQAVIMKSFLDDFCNLLINKRIASVYGSPLTKNLGKYLGVPLIHGRINSKTYIDLLEKTHKRLVAWKNDTLSLTGRATFIKAVGGSYKMRMECGVNFLGIGELVVGIRWNIQKMAVVLPWPIIHRIVIIHVGGLHSGSSRIIWGWNLSGDFSIKSAYNGFMDASYYHSWPWKFIWALKIPPRIQHFLWILLHGRILTNLQGSIRGMTVDTACPRCHVGIESVDHLFQSCKVSVAVWENVCKGLTSSGSFNVDLESPQSIIFRFCRDWLAAIATGPAREVVNFSVMWLPPVEGWVKLNVDGSCDDVSGIITAGGVLGNHVKEWVKGFVMKKGVGSVIEVELWGFLKGLSMSWNAGFRKISVETDSLDVVHLLSKASIFNQSLYCLIQGCKSFINGDCECHVQHVFREGNKLAHGLARMGHGIVLFDAPFTVANVFVADSRGIAISRLCPVISSS
ncbi:hypothetical protein Ddye_028422 [Dipteronia dyeriana]|uniref:Reverse transcriptase n=1 Tax=Dipteronia dyeriana TaxID=168575 RepID=A0AAD9TR01_9ROSI|nr:hypothetical protein Ddye_028422 [Dipteronia dyeriana]